jgi:predicted ATP-grasp superfamily ATP-dependent carboligase
MRQHGTRNRSRGRLRPALILDARHRQSLVALRSLGRAGVETFAADREGPARVSRWCSECAVLPDVGDSADVFVNHVIDLCVTVGSPVIISGHDGTIDALRARRSEVAQVGSLALASDDALSVASDKRATLEFAQRLGIDVPQTRTVRNISEGPDAINEVGLPVVVKPLRSWVPRETGGWFAGPPTVARNEAAAVAHIKRLIDGGVPALVQPWLSGSREAVSIFLADDVVWAKFAVRSSRMFPLIGGASIVRETIPMPADIGPMSEALVREMSLEGYAEVEFRRDGNGRAFLMEVNPRLNAGVEVAVRAGVNVPLLLYRWAAGEPFQSALDYRAGQRMRWLNGDARWLKEALRDPLHPDAPGRTAAVSTFLADFARPAGYDYLDWGDLRLALTVLIYEAAQAVRIVRKVRARAGVYLRRRRSLVRSPVRR